MLSSVRFEAEHGQQLKLRNPAYAGYFADPFVFHHAGFYYAVGTGDVSDGSSKAFPMLRSSDFVLWEAIGGALEKPEVEGDAFWAPEIAFQDGVFYLYYSLGVSDRGHHLRVATSSRPDGGFVDTGVPLVGQRQTPFAIDASPFRDDDGRWYVFYARDFLDTKNGARPGTALVVSELESMTQLNPAYTVVMRAHHDWQRYEANRTMYGNAYDWHTLEGPCVRKHEGRYFCFYSGGNWQNESYGLDYVVADSVMGPYTDSNDGSGPRLLKTVPGKVIGPGHNSVVVGPDGREYLAYHAWSVDGSARRMCFDVLSWTADGPVCDGPS